MPPSTAVMASPGPPAAPSLSPSLASDPAALIPTASSLMAPTPDPKPARALHSSVGIDIGLSMDTTESPPPPPVEPAPHVPALDLSATTTTLNTPDSPTSTIIDATPSALAATTATTTFIPTDRSLPDRAVSSSSLDGAYIRFILYCNPAFGLDTDVTQLRIGFCSPPQSEGQTFDMWRLYQLYGELMHRQIKTWTDLVRAWGVRMPTEGQSTQKVQQYSSRLKRWMHGLHIDAFFDYLYGRDHPYYRAVQPPHPQLPASEDDQALRALSQNSRSRRGRQRIEIGGGPLILQYQSQGAGTTPSHTPSTATSPHLGPESDVFPPPAPPSASGSTPLSGFPLPTAPSTASTPTPSSAASNFSSWRMISFSGNGGSRKRPRVDTSAPSSSVDNTPATATSAATGISRFYTPTSNGGAAFGDSHHSARLNTHTPTSSSSATAGYQQSGIGSPLVWVHSESAAGGSVAPSHASAYSSASRPMSAIEPATSSSSLGGGHRLRPVATPVSALEPGSVSFRRAAHLAAAAAAASSAAHDHGGTDHSSSVGSPHPSLMNDRRLVRHREMSPPSPPPPAGNHNHGKNGRFLTFALSRAGGEGPGGPDISRRDDSTTEPATQPQVPPPRTVGPPPLRLESTGGSSQSTVPPPPPSINTGSAPGSATTPRAMGSRGPPFGHIAAPFGLPPTPAQPHPYMPSSQLHPTPTSSGNPVSSTSAPYPSSYFSPSFRSAAAAAAAAAAAGAASCGLSPLHGTLGTVPNSAISLNSIGGGLNGMSPAASSYNHPPLSSSYPPSYSALENALAADLARAQYFPASTTPIDNQNNTPKKSNPTTGSTTTTATPPPVSLNPAEARALATTVLNRLRGPEFPLSGDGDAGWRISAASWLDLSTWFGGPVPVWHPSMRRKIVRCVLPRAATTTPEPDTEIEAKANVAVATAAAAAMAMAVSDSNGAATTGAVNGTANGTTNGAHAIESPPVDAPADPDKPSDADANSSAADIVMTDAPAQTTTSTDDDDDDDTTSSLSSSLSPSSSSTITVTADDNAPPQPSQPSQNPTASAPASAPAPAATPAPTPVWSVEWTAVLGGATANMTIDNLIIQDNHSRPLAPPDYQVSAEVSNLDVWRLKMLRSLFEDH